MEILGFVLILAITAVAAMGLGYPLGMVTDRFHSPPQGFRSEDD